jgi:hypothetical protein
MTDTSDTLYGSHSTLTFVNALVNSTFGCVGHVMLKRFCARRFRTFGPIGRTNRKIRETWESLITVTVTLMNAGKVYA